MGLFCLFESYWFVSRCLLTPANHFELSILLLIPKHTGYVFVTLKHISYSNISSGSETFSHIKQFVTKLRCNISRFVQSMYGSMYIYLTRLFSVSAIHKAVVLQ